MQKDALFDSPWTVLVRSRRFGPANQKRSKELIIS
jgi:hypothetical protein